MIGGLSIFEHSSLVSIFGDQAFFVRPLKIRSWQNVIQRVGLPALLNKFVALQI